QMEGAEPRIGLIAPKRGTSNHEKTKGANTQALRQALVQSRTLWKCLTKYFPDHEKTKHHINAIDIPVPGWVMAGKIERSDQKDRIATQKPKRIDEEKRISAPQALPQQQD